MFLSTYAWCQDGGIKFVNNSNNKLSLTILFEKVDYNQHVILNPLQSFGIHWIAKKRLKSFEIKTDNFSAVLSGKLKTVNEGVYAVGDILDLHNNNKSLWGFSGKKITIGFKVFGGYKNISLTVDNILPLGTYKSTCNTASYTPNKLTLSIKCRINNCHTNCLYDATLTGLDIFDQGISTSAIPKTVNITNAFFKSNSAPHSGNFTAELKAEGWGSQLPEGGYKSHASMAYFDHQNKKLYACCRVIGAHGEINEKGIASWAQQTSKYVVSMLDLTKNKDCADIICNNSGILECTKKGKFTY